MANHADGRSTANGVKRPRRWLRFFVRLGVGLVILVVSIDFIYSRVVAQRIEAWEATVDRDANGVQRNCETYTLGSGDTALLFVHGINDSPRCWDNLTGALAKRNFTCRAMRLPGFAQSVDEYAKYGHQDWIAAVDKELTALRANHQRVGIVAHSLGGAVTIGQLRERPESAEFAVLLAPGVAVSNERSPLLSTRAWHNIARRLLWFSQTTWSPFDIDCHDPTIETYAGRMPCTPLVVVDELFALMDANLPRAEELETPLLMVLTRDDRVIDWQAAADYFERIGADEKQLMYLDDSGHSITVDHNWPQVVDAIAEFTHARQ